MELVLSHNHSFEDQLHLEMPILRRIASWITHDVDRAADLLQDTMVLAIRFKDSYRNDINLRAWLTRIMKNRHISNMRRLSLEQRILGEGFDSSIAHWSMGESGRRAGEKDGAVSTDDGFSDTVLGALNDLKSEYRDVVMLCDVEGLSYAETSAALRCPLGTVMSRLHRGRRELRRRLISRHAISSAA